MAPLCTGGAELAKTVPNQHELILSGVPPTKSSSRFKKPCTTLLLDATLSMGVEDGVKPPSDGAAAAKTSPVRTALIVALYLALNSSLNLLNRYTLGHAGFRYPVSLTCAHLVFQICSLAPVVLSGKPAGETHAQTVGRLWKALAAIGAFMSLNIALNNASLLHLSLSFNQVIRASIPVVCAACAVVVEHKVPSPAEAAGLFLVAAGVMATIAGSADKSKQRPDETIGIVFCVVATLSNALMMTFSGRIMGPERLNALYLTFYTSPVVLALLAPVSAGMEWERMVARLAMPAPNDVIVAGVEVDGTELLGSAGDASGGGGLIGDGGFVGGGDLAKLVLLGCCNAVVYNWVHNKVIAVTSATTTTVLGNVKVAMLFLFSRVLFGETKDWSWQMLGGAVVALVGFALYSGAKLRAMRKAKLAAVK